MEVQNPLLARQSVVFLKAIVHLHVFGVYAVRHRELLVPK